MNIRKKNLIYVSKKYCAKEHVDLLLIGEERKINYVLIKDFYKLICNHTLRCRRKCFCRYFLQAFKIE